MSKTAPHYYTRQPVTESRRETVTYELRRTGNTTSLATAEDARNIANDCILLTFVTDSGVFSKSRVDFGTDLLIRSLPPLHGRILDLGCGYGAAGISLALLNPGAEVWFSDVNERAVGLCRENYARLAASGRPGARIEASDGFEAFGGVLFDTIVTNPPVRAGKANLFRLYGDAYNHLAEGGALYVVLQKKQGMESTAAELARLSGNCTDIARKSGFHVLRVGKIHMN